MINGLLWTIHLLNRSGHRQYLLKQLQAGGVPAGELSNIQQFSKACVGSGGMLALNLVAENAGGMVAGEVILEMWKNFSSDKESNINTQVVKGQHAGQYEGQGESQGEGIRERASNKDFT